MARIAFLSDLHLSPTHGFFWDNFCRARDAALASGAEAVVVCGDLCINGPDSDAEMEFARAALAGWPVPVLALPGNHDVGDEPPGQDPAQLIDAPRLARWDAAFGTDRFAHDAGDWRVLGVNAQLWGSGLPREAEQDAWLAGELAAASGHPAALVLHKPLFLEHAGEAEPTIASLNPAPRARLLRLLAGSPVRLVISGHLHATRDAEIDGLRHVWLPATAFTGSGGPLAKPAVGAVTIDFGDDALVAPLPIPGLVSHDLAAIKQHGRYRFLRDMPECPPDLAA
jgi:3',5'-cyclic AMP phosphodiesterase CpdA